MTDQESSVRNGKKPVLVVVQLTGGNDFMNTVIPYASSVYYDSRPTVGVPQEEVLPFNDTLAFHPVMGPFKELYDEGSVAIVQGIGYPNSSRSHFRGMDIWHTCEPNEVVTDGWLGNAIHDLDPKHENVLTGVNFSAGLPRAMVAPGVPVSSVADLDSYGVMTGIKEESRRSEVLETFEKMYAPAIGAGPVKDYLRQTGINVLRGADRLREAPVKYRSDVEYADNPIAKSLRDIARVHLADLGTRVFYASQGGYDVHALENPAQPKLLGNLSEAISDFFQDIRGHDSSDEVAMLVFTEFGRRIKDNGSGTDHGSGGGAFIIGDRVKGGLYAEYPPLAHDQWLNSEDMRHTIDFRSIYGTVLERWLGLDATMIVRGTYEQIKPFEET